MPQQSHYRACTPKKNHNWKRHMYPNIHCTVLFIIARTRKKPRCSSKDEWIDKLWYIYTMEYSSAMKSKAFESVLMRWMNLEPIIQSEVSQKEKQISYINAYMWNLERWQWWTYFQGSNGDEDIENRLMDTVREEKGGINGESSMETYTLPYVK